MRWSTVRRGGCQAGLVIVLSLGGCTFTPHDVQLSPPAQNFTSDVGHGTRVFFRFVDDRDDVTVGHRGVGGNGAKINASELPGLVEAQLRDALIKKNFQLVSVEPEGEAAVTYRLRAFKFDIERGFFSGGQNTAAALAVDARRSDKSYAQVYRFNAEQRIQVVPGSDEINSVMNAALTQILQQATTDAALDQLLAHP
jgi:uncharacterized lipoprotein YajG